MSLAEDVPVECAKCGGPVCSTCAAIPPDCWARFKIEKARRAAHERARRDSWFNAVLAIAPVGVPSIDIAQALAQLGVPFVDQRPSHARRVRGILESLGWRASMARDGREVMSR